ncbi:hypothetical protein BC936DRAFT_141264, partial [Jimgerdemannia flammicorona]
KLPNYGIYITSFITCAAQGLLLCIVFCFDPTLHEIWNEKKAELIQRHYVNYNARLGRTVDSRPYSPPMRTGGLAANGFSRKHSSNDRRRDVTFASASASESTLNQSTRWDTFMNRMVNVLFLEKEERKVTPSLEMTEQGQLREMHTQDGSNSYGSGDNDHSQTPHRDITSEISIDNDDELYSHMPQGTPVFELVPLQKTTAAVGNPRWSAKEPKDQNRGQIRSITPNSMVTDTISASSVSGHPLHQRRGSASSSLTDNSESYVGGAPVTRVSSFLRQPARRTPQPSPKQHAEATGSANHRNQYGHKE